MRTQILGRREPAKVIGRSSRWDKEKTGDTDVTEDRRKKYLEKETEFALLKVAVKSKMEKCS